MAKKTNGKKEEALAIIPASEYAVLNLGDNADIAEVMKANLGNKPLDQYDLETYNAPPGGATFLEMYEGEPPVQELTGIILSHREVRAFWKDKPGQGESSKPDCVSKDGITGVGKPGDKVDGCEVCPLNEFESAMNDDGSKGKGKACPERKLLFFLQPNLMMPIVLRLTSSSIYHPMGERKYMVSLSNRNIKFSKAITRITFMSDKNDDNMKFTRMCFSKVGTLSNEEHTAIEKYAESFAKTFARDVEIDASE